jgi:Ni/Fe-hydrogenase subunit HybB-like protein
MLLLTRQRWRTSISRFAEAMTLFAAATAGLFPILHLGRPWLFMWLVPYPNTLGLTPQWRSPLVWDFFAIASYLLFSLMFWYTGALPDFATLRDRAPSRAARIFYGILALGWRNSARHWHVWQSYYGAMAALGVPLVISVHSVVGLDFAAGIAPGWAETIFPPYFVVGAMFSGFAMVVVLAATFRHALDIPDLVTDSHFDVMGKVLLFGAWIMALSYATEWFYAWYSREAAERYLVAFEFNGFYAPLYLTMLACNCLIPQLYWLPWARRTLPVTLTIAVLINLGMWLERILIVAMPPARNHLPSQWSAYWPTIWDWLLFVGTLGFFGLLFTLFIRVIPAVSMHEVKAGRSRLAAVAGSGIRLDDLRRAPRDPAARYGACRRHADRPSRGQASAERLGRSSARLPSRGVLLRRDAVPREVVGQPAPGRPLVCEAQRRARPRHPRPRPRPDPAVLPAPVGPDADGSPGPPRCRCLGAGRRLHAHRLARRMRRRKPLCRPRDRPRGHGDLADRTGKDGR